MNKRRKTLQELTFKDSFMFAAVMLDEENAKGVIERALDILVDHVEISYEKSIVYNPEYRGIRLDVYLKDDKNRHFNVEMQVANTEILKRSRYYHSQIDMELLSTGIDYEQLPETYVIFICDYDPIGLGKYKYTRCQMIEEDRDYHYDDGSYTIFLSTVGTNEDEVSKDLVNFLKYVGAELEESQNDYSDEFVKRLHRRQQIRGHRDRQNRVTAGDDKLPSKLPKSKENQRNVNDKDHGTCRNPRQPIHDNGNSRHSARRQIIRIQEQTDARRINDRRHCNYDIIP